MLAIAIVIVIFLCLILPYDHLHPLISPGNNWIQMWSLLVPEFWHRFETLCRFLFLHPCHDVISSVDSCPGGTLMWGQTLGQRERERGILLLSQISAHSVLLTSQHADSHLELLLVMLWQIYVWCARRTLRVFCVEWREVCAGSKPSRGREAGQGIGHMKLLMGCRCCFGGGSERKTGIAFYDSHQWGVERK